MVKLTTTSQIQVRQIALPRDRSQLHHCITTLCPGLMWLLSVAEHSTYAAGWQWWLAEAKGIPVAFFAGHRRRPSWWGGGGLDLESILHLIQAIGPAFKGERLSASAQVIDPILEACGWAHRVHYRRESIAMRHLPEATATLEGARGHFRLARRDDVDALMAFDLTLEEQSPRQARQVLLWRIMRQEVGVVEVDGQIRCMGEGVRCGAHRDLQRIETLKNHRRHGLATQLVGGWLAFCEKEGLGTCLSVERENHGAILLYKKLGFRPWWRRVDIRLLDD